MWNKLGRMCRSEMFWRNVHRFVLAFPFVSGAVYSAIMLFAATASGANEEAKALVANQVVMWRAIMLASYGFLWLFALLGVWLWAFLYSGQRFETLAKEREWANRPRVPAAVQERKQAMSPRTHGAVTDMLRKAIDGLPFPDHSPKPKASQIARDQIDEMTRMAPAISGATSEVQYRPKPDMNLTELLVRVYKHLGGAPKEQPERDDFIRKIDFEIIDQITENGLHVWGRYGDRAREPISAYSLTRGKLNHRKDTFAVPSVDSGPMVFRELRFNRDEVDQIWPKQ